MLFGGGLCLAKQLKFEYVIVESDSLSVVFALNDVLDQCPWKIRLCGL